MQDAEIRDENHESSFLKFQDCVWIQSASCKVSALKFFIVHSVPELPSVKTFLVRVS